MVFGIRRVIYYIVENNFSIFTFCSSARVASTKIRPLCSSVMIFLREAISICTCGGIVKYEPPEAPLSMGTTANPFLTLLRIFVYAFAKRFSIFVFYSSDFSRRTFSSFSVSARIASKSPFLCFRCSSRSFKRSFVPSITSFFCSI